jgi:hypothetical protein
VAKKQLQALPWHPGLPDAVVISLFLDRFHDLQIRQAMTCRIRLAQDVRTDCLNKSRAHAEQEVFGMDYNEKTGGLEQRGKPHAQFSTSTV